MKGAGMEEKTNSSAIADRRAAIYARSSSGDHDGTAIDDQIDACMKYCYRNGYEVVAVYTDFAPTGRDDDRPQFLQMVKDSESGKFDVVVVWNMGRISRDMTERSRYEGELSLRVVAIEPCDKDIAGSSLGTAIGEILSSVVAEANHLKDPAGRM